MGYIMEVNSSYLPEMSDKCHKGCFVRLKITNLSFGATYILIFNADMSVTMP